MSRKPILQNLICLKYMILSIFEGFVGRTNLSSGPHVVCGPRVWDACSIDHGGSDKPGCGPGEVEKNSMFWKTKNLSSVFQTAKLFWGELEKQVYPSFPRSMPALTNNNCSLHVY